LGLKERSKDLVRWRPEEHKKRVFSKDAAETIKRSSRKEEKEE